MERNKIGFNTIDEYIAAYPKSVQIILKGLRKAIKATAPDIVKFRVSENVRKGK
jgi:hypothetical protein